jgi:uncharacterized protein (DUF1330 family)
MSAYVISEVDVRDAAGFEAYRTIAAKAIAQYGGRYLVRGGAASTVEGGPPPKTIIVVEFPTMERLREWYASPEYAEAYLALSAIPEARGEKYWKKIEKDKGKPAVVAAFEAADRYYRRAFLLNPLVDLRIMGKVEEQSELHEGDFIIRIWWLRPFTRSLKEIHEGRYQKAFDLLQNTLHDQRAGADGIEVASAGRRWCSRAGSSA